MERRLQEEQGGRVEEAMLEKKEVEESYEKKLKDQSEGFKIAQAQVGDDRDVTWCDAMVAGACSVDIDIDIDVDTPSNVINQINMEH